MNQDVNRRILVIDDNKDILNDFKKLLANNNQKKMS